jgi:gamma-glutamyl:cysteine ligase YbdK (ATP-grasp superfamily)
MTAPMLRVIDADATPEEVAAIVAAIGALHARSAANGAEERDDTLHEWVRTARLQSRRSGLQRGPWRLSGRVSRRTRA